MSTTDKNEALCSAAGSAILNSGYYYYVFKGEQMLGCFYTEEEN